MNYMCCVHVPMEYRHQISSKTGVTDNCEAPCGSWELTPGFMQELLMLSITELFL